MATTRNPTAKWPEGWQYEADRLAAFYTRTALSSDEYDRGAGKKRQYAKELARLQASCRKLEGQIAKLLEAERADQIVHLYNARPRERDDGDVDLRHLDRLLDFHDQLGALGHACTELAADAESAIERLKANSRPLRGNQSMLVLRFLIAAAAIAYVRLFAKPPGRSRGNGGSFGRFVLEIINRVPVEHRPRKPSPSMIDDVLESCERRRAVAERSG